MFTTAREHLEYLVSEVYGMTRSGITATIVLVKCFSCSCLVTYNTSSGAQDHLTIPGKFHAVVNLFFQLYRLQGVM